MTKGQKGFQKGHGNIGGGNKKGCTPWNKGYNEKRKDVIEKQRLAHLGKKHTPEHIERMKKSLPRGEAHWVYKKNNGVLTCSGWNRGLKLPQFSGENSPHWISDRTLLTKKQERNDSAYREWRISVWKRDNFKCRISNNDCDGNIEAHHILGWTEYVELRYEINNGITLCHAHHSKKRAEEKQLIPMFKELIVLSSTQI